MCARSNQHVLSICGAAAYTRKDITAVFPVHIQFHLNAVGITCMSHCCMSRVPEGLNYKLVGGEGTHCENVSIYQHGESM